MQQLSDKLWSWATEIDDATIRQAESTSRLSIVRGHVALMADAHLGIGSTVGSVIPTENAVISAAVGVDLGCGMSALKFPVKQDQLPDSLDSILRQIERAIPAGVGVGHDGPASKMVDSWFALHVPSNNVDYDLLKVAKRQFGSLGSGNHFVELCIDEDDFIWLMWHSGSRGVGNKLAQRHINKSRKLAKACQVEDPDLAWFTQGTPEFDEYIVDMLWSQDYARANRDAMGVALQKIVRKIPGFDFAPIEVINCHHNFTQLENHDGRDLWITRKGAIEMRIGQKGIIPGSMGTGSFIVSGTGNADSYNSASHGAGRRLSRGAAKRQFTRADLEKQMGDRTWLAADADKLIDEIPAAYKDIEDVMLAQKDLVNIEHKLTSLINYKGV